MTTNPNTGILANLDPIKQLELVNADDYELLIEDWQRAYLKTKYKKVERLGGGGDKGRDVICTCINGDTHVFQCKHYGRKLNVTDVLIEVAKCCYHSHKGVYKKLKKYYFVSPQGLSTKARDLIYEPDELKMKLKARWNQTCQSKITKSEEILLSGKLLAHINAFDFSVFDYVIPKDFIEDFKTTGYYYKWFKDLVKSRNLDFQVPKAYAKNEMKYIKKIFEAYSDYLNKNVIDADVLKNHHPILFENFNRQREYFYSAEYLAAFSRETYTQSDYFKRLKDEVYHGIIDEIQDDAKNGFDRLKKVLKRAETLIFCQSNPLCSEVNVKDRKGICHHLANERGDVRWKS